MAVTRIQEGGLGTDSFNLPITLNGTDLITQAKENNFDIQILNNKLKQQQLNLMVQ